MDKVSIGIDIAKDTLEVHVLDLDNADTLTAFACPNTAGGHGHLLRAIAPYEVAHLVLEATGIYHRRLVRRLAEAGLPVAVINPLQLKRFAQMKLRRLKTDRSDARLLAEYGREQQPPAHQVPPLVEQHLKQLNTHIEQLVKQRTALQNMAHANAQWAASHSVCEEVLEDLQAQLRQALSRLEAAQEALIASTYGEVQELIESVVGVGRRTALALVAYLGTFERFETHQQVAAYMGLNPVPVESGTSLRPRCHISKQGNARLRTLLYLCALSARRHNRVCRSLYERLLAAGKAKKVALIAVANKLVKLIFTVVKKGEPFDNEYLEKRALLT